MCVLTVGGWYMENFSKALSQVMQEHGLNQLQLSKLLDIRQSQISNWIRGKSLPGFYSIRRICEVLHVSADELLEIEK